MRAHEKGSARDDHQRRRIKHLGKDATTCVKKTIQRKYLKESQLTDTQRRDVRHQQRDLLKKMKENSNDLAKLSTGTFEEMTKQLDKIYVNVRFPCEADLDAVNLDELSSAVSRQSQELGASDLTKVVAYDAADLIGAVRRQCSSETEFDWATLGSAAGACFRSVPETNFLFGLMDTQVAPKEPKKATRRAKAEDEDAEETKPSEYMSKADRKDAQTRRLKKMQNAVEESGTLRMLDVVVNPASFSQTVENLFDMSFLVRNGEVEVGIDNGGLPYLQNHDGAEERPAQSQSIISITPAQWEELSGVWGSDEPLVGHRS